MSKQANMLKKMQESFAKMQAELEQKTVEGTAGGGMVTVTVNGHMKVMKININPDIIKDGDKEILEDMIIAAVNNGMEKAQQLMQTEMSKITGGLPIPNMF
ncbi:MAG: YbaB/EbfC family nucleoid-associated protein [bacterium]|nr:YbaB/EbfC family nucleoid-associated protein [bacterium]